MRSIAVVFALLGVGCASSLGSPLGMPMPSLFDVINCWPKSISEAKSCGLELSKSLRGHGELEGYVEHAGEQFSIAAEVLPTGEINHWLITSRSGQPYCAGGEVIERQLNEVAGEVLDVDFMHRRNNSGDDAGLITVEMRQKNGKQLAVHKDENGCITAMYILLGD